MYHAQDAPPSHATNINLAGITWVDLVFPFFLFAMGAAFPLALGRRLDKGMTKLQGVGMLGRRYILLGAFAILQPHFNPSGIGAKPDTWAWLGALAGFALYFPTLARLPEAWPAARRAAIRMAGWAGVVVLLAVLSWYSSSHGGKAFSLDRGNIILIVLTNMAFFGGVVWLFTRGNLMARLLVLLAFVALRATKQQEGNWVAVGLHAHARAVDLCAALPEVPVHRDPRHDRGRPDRRLECAAGGTMTRRARGDGPTRAPWRWRCSWRATSCGTSWRWRRAGWWPCVVVNAAVCAAGFALTAGARSSTEKLLRALFVWGVYWLAVGLVFEPLEGGIKKSNATMSYHFVTAGLAFFALVAFTVITDVLRRPRWVSLLVDNGQNPMIAYVAAGNLVIPILALTHLNGALEAITPGPWPGFARALFITLLGALAAEAVHASRDILAHMKRAARAW